ncbi:MAG: DUF3108 domain-containing protein [Chitinophagales bacterium]|nr:DUF3108 domain-containing protein [Chitinophagales bacterium]
MKYRFFSLVTLITVSFALMSTTLYDCSSENYVFKSGEELKFKVYYNWKAVWIGAGEVEFDLREAYLNGKKYLYSKATGKTMRKYDLFFKVRDSYETYMDPYSLKPRKFIRDVNEGGYEIFNNYEFNWDKNQIISESEDYKTPYGTDTFDLKDCTHDVLSSIYYLRTLNLDASSVGDTIPLRVFIDNKFHDLHIRYLGKEIVKTNLGKFRCIKVSPVLIKGRIFDENESMLVYVTDDANRLPILIETPISVGSVKAILTDYDGVRNPLTAKL